MKKQYDELHVMEYRDGSKESFGYTTVLYEHPAEIWEVDHALKFKNFLEFLRKALENDYPGNLKNPYLLGLLQIFKENKTRTDQEKSHFLYYRKEEDIEMAAVVKHFYQRAAEIELFYSGTRTDFIEDFVNFIAEYIFEKREDVSSLVCISDSADQVKKSVLEAVDFYWSGVLRKAFPSGNDALIYEFIPVTRRT